MSKRETAEERFASFPTTPIINIIQVSARFCDKLYNDRLTLLQAQRGQPCVSWLKARLGEQNYCWNGEYRYWIWELPGEKARVWASNIQGWGLTPKEAMIAWYGFYNTVNPLTAAEKLAAHKKIKQLVSERKTYV